MPAPHRKPTQSQPAAWGDQFVLEALQGFLPALTAVLLAHFAYARLRLDGEAAVALAAISLAASLMCGFLYWGLRRRLFDVQRSHVLAEVVWGGTLLNQDFHFGPGTVKVYTRAAPNTTSFRAEPCT